MSPNIMEKLLQSISSNDYYIGIAAIIMLLVEAICSVYIGIYGLFTLSKNCIRYVFSAKFRQTFKESNDKQFMLKPHD